MTPKSLPEAGEAAGQDLDGDPRKEQLTAELRAELLDAESWGKILDLYARTTRLAVALVDADGGMVGTCHNPQPIWSLARRTSLPEGATCPFCLQPDGICTAAADALRTEGLVLVHDQAGFAHVALPLSLEGQHLGTLIAGQVFDRYPEPLPLQRLARDFGLSAQHVWHLASQQAAISRANLTVYGELLRTLGQAFLKERYSSILEKRLAETSRRFNEELETVNVELSRKVMELDRSNGDLQNLLDGTQIATLFLDRALDLKRFTPAAGKEFGLTDRDLGQPIADLASRFADAGLFKDVKEVLRTLAVRERDLIGTQGRHFLVRSSPYRTIRHAADGVVVTFVDVTQLKQAEQSAEGARIYAENIVSTVRHPLMVLDSQLRVKSANSAFYRTFQVNQDATEGRFLYELGTREWDIPELRLLMGELLPLNGTVKDFPVDYDFAGPGQRTMLLNACRIDHEQLILLAMEDITERKRAETQLQTLNLDLKHFSFAVSHDLQEPLRMVVSYSQLLARRYKDKLDPQAGEYISYAVEGARRMERLLTDLRGYWLVNEEGVLRTGVDCNLAVENAIEVFREPLKQNGGMVTHDALPTILAEEVPLAMLFQNLIGNANKYCRLDRPPRIHVWSRPLANGWWFSIKDNGMGIEAPYLEQIFLPFKRLHGADYPGSGLGLAMCQKIVERYGGRLWVESTYGEGSTFHFTVPASLSPSN